MGVRTEEMELQLTAAEWKAIERQAHRHGMTVDVFCRAILLEAARVEFLKRQRETEAM
jgi:hypothetical protein